MERFYELVAKLNELYTIECCEDNIWIFELNVVLSYDVSSSYVSIYRECLYFDCNDDQKYLSALFENLLFLQGLYVASKECPRIEIHESKGDIEGVECVGFYGVELKEEDVLEILGWFERVDYGEDKLNFDILKQSYPVELERYLRLEDEMALELSFLRNEGWKEISDFSKFSKKNEYDGIYVNSFGSIVCGLGGGKFNLVCEAFGIEKYVDIRLYKGFDYCIGKYEDRNLYWDVRLVNEVNDIIEYLGFEIQNDICYYVTDGFPQMLLVKYTNFWWIVLPIKENGLERAIKEMKKLKQKYEELSYYIPKGYREEMIDFSQISAEKFEWLCRDLLIEMGFVEVYLRGKTNEPDGGVDIECIEEDKRIFETRRIRWIFQCKHVKKQLDRKDLSEIPMLLEEFSAECFGLFYTGSFSAQTLDRIENINKSRYDCIKCWDGAYISQLIDKFPRIKEKYFGI